MTKLHLLPISLVLVAGAAYAQPKTTPPGQAKKEAAAPADAAKPAPPPADKKMPPAEPPKPAEPAQELKDAAKGMAGTWKCTGQAEVMGQMIDVKATITHKVDSLGGFWINTSFTGTAAAKEMAKMPPMKSTWYTTYNANQKKWYRTMMNGRGGVGWGWGTMTGTKASWEGEAHWPDGTDVKTRATEEMVSPKEMHATGEYSKDGGKTWNKDHDATCKK